MDREKVIGHLNDCMEASRADNGWVFVRKDIIADALALLKEQEEQISIKTENFNRLVAKIGVMPKIVLCKDCVHWDKGHTEECGNPDSICFHTGWCKPDWFCPRGERRS